MNYGYRDTDPERDEIFWQRWHDLDLSNIDPAFFDMARLYYEVCKSGDVSDFSEKNVLEIGSGRGGGAAFIARNFNPSSITGIDLAIKAIAFCQQKHNKTPNVKFQQGDAENLLFPNETYDIAINIESSHCYGNFEKFISETHRVLKKDGLFYFADFRPKSATEKIKDSLLNAGFSIVHHRDITANVVKSLDYTNSEKKKFLERTFPKFMQRFFRTFAGLKGTYMYEQFANREMIYTLYVLRKT